MCQKVPVSFQCRTRYNLFCLRSNILLSKFSSRVFIQNSYVYWFLRAFNFSFIYLIRLFQDTLSDELIQYSGDSKIKFINFKLKRWLYTKNI